MTDSAQSGPLSRELARVWNKWTGFPTPPQSEQACLQATDALFMMVAHLLTSEKQSFPPDVAQSRRLGEALGAGLARLARLCYMLGLDHGQTRSTHPHTAQSLSGQARFASSFIEEAARPAKLLLAAIVSDATGAGLISREVATSLARSSASRLLTTAVTCYQTGLADAPDAPTRVIPFRAADVPRLAQRWAEFPVPEAAQGEILDTALRVEAAVDGLRELLSYRAASSREFAAFISTSANLRHNSSRRIEDTMRHAFFLGLEFASLTVQPPQTLSHQAIVLIAVICEPLASWLTSLPETLRTSQAPGEDNERLVANIKQLALAGAIRCYFAGLQAYDSAGT